MVPSSGSKDPDSQTGRWLLEAYKILNDTFGDLHWWPGDSQLEIIVGAILTQNTSWQNVERAIAAIKERELLNTSFFIETDDHALANLIRPSGYYNIKAKRLKSFFRFLKENCNGSLEEMFSRDLSILRSQLLEVNGIGEETADSILLYAGEKPVFVVDTYTKRILGRHGIIEEKSTYADIQHLFMKHLPQDVRLYNQYHALIVETGKRYCRKESLCHACPLGHLDGHFSGRKDETE
ncbi:MAG: Endonuclease III [Syntrophus sp. SKADARSKE-3]|nr:Endonuclease III [Syntrophus sp. SKADARSKE-3]